jgi:hypothetical protein
VSGRWRPGREQCVAPDRACPHGQPPTDPRLRGPSDSERTQQTRDHPHAQASHRQRDLPAPHPSRRAAPTTLTSAPSGKPRKSPSLSPPGTSTSGPPSSLGSSAGCAATMTSPGNTEPGSRPPDHPRFRRRRQTLTPNRSNSFRISDQPVQPFSRQSPQIRRTGFCRRRKYAGKRCDRGWPRLSGQRCAAV